jgi:MFS family permease
VVFTVVAVLLLDRVGRRALLFVGTTGLAVSLFMLGAFFALDWQHAAPWVALLSLIVFMASFAIGLGPVFWLMISEIYPLRIRGTAMSVASIANWGSNWIVALTFPVLLATLGGAGSFWLFAVLGIVAWFFVYFRVPETKNRTLEEIEASFRGTTVGTSRAQ